MTQYIGKSALVAEIEKLIERAKAERVLHPKTILAAKNYLLIEDYKKLLSFLDTLEVKEVDLDKETTHYLLYEHRSPLNEIMHKADLKSEMQYHKDIENAFKAGFKLGMAVSKVKQRKENRYDRQRENQKHR